MRIAYPLRLKNEKLKHHTVCFIFKFIKNMSYMNDFSEFSFFGKDIFEV